MIAVFKTTVENKKDAERIVDVLKETLPKARISFDLEDCDNILRIEANSIDIELVKNIVGEHKHNALPLKKADIII